jgi:hypothetical protein
MVFNAINTCEHNMTQKLTVYRVRYSSHLQVEKYARHYVPKLHH